MTKRKRPKGHMTIYKTLHRKLKIEQQNPTNEKKGGKLGCLGRVSISCFTWDTRRDIEICFFARLL